MRVAQNFEILGNPKDREVKRLVRPILEWMIWNCVKEINEETSYA